MKEERKKAKLDDQKKARDDKPTPAQEAYQEKKSSWQHSMILTTLRKRKS